MRLSEFWMRMDDALGPQYARSWANDYVLPSLGGQTVESALAAGWDAKTVWRAVHDELDLPPVSR